MFNTKTKLVTICVVAFIFIIWSVPLAHAENDDTIDLSAIPKQLAEKLNIPLFAAQLLFSSIFLTMFLFPTLLLTRNYEGQLIVGSAVGLTVMGFCIVMEWLPVWIFLIVCVIAALMFSGKIRTWITGGPTRGD